MNRYVILLILTIMVFASSIFFIFMAYFIVSDRANAVFGCFLGGCGIGAVSFAIIHLLYENKKRRVSNESNTSKLHA